MTALTDGAVARPDAAAPGFWTQARLALTIARRELRGGLTGFRIFLACLTLGVGAIATVQSVSGGILDALRSDGRAILGGDVALRLLYREATPDQRAWLAERGTLLTSAEMRAMARDPQDAGRSALVELKSVGPAYPLYGTFEIADGALVQDRTDVQAALAERGGTWGALIEDTLAARLDLAPGDRVAVGEAVLEVRGLIAREPDRAGSGSFSLGPRLLVADGALAATDLVQPGSLITWSYLLRLPPGSDPAAFRTSVEETFPAAGWRIRDFTDAAPQLARFIDRLTLFLTLVGLTALLVGGVGVGNAVRSYLESKTATIATLKCLGARGGLIFEAYLAQILALALLGTALGLLLGAVAPVLAGRALAGLLPITARIGVYPEALAVAAGFGLLTALAFSLWPLGRAREVPAAALFRDAVAPGGGRPRPLVLALLLAAVAGLAGLAVGTADAKLFAAAFVAGSAATLGAFWAAGWLVTRVAARLGRPRRPVLRLALANIHRPGNPTGAVVLSLGLGLTVLVAIALIEGNFRRAVLETMPEGAPAFFFVDIQPDQLDDFSRTVLAVPGTADLNRVPQLRGRISTVNGRPAEEAVVNREHAWVLNGDRGVTYRAEAPADDKVLAGGWWPADYRGPAKLAVYKDIADAFGIGPGDRMAINILGRDIEAEVAVVRDLDFRSMGINFTLVFSPGVLEAAPHTWLATVRAEPDSELAVQRAVTERYSNITAVRVRDALETVGSILTNIGMAVRVTAAVTLLAGTLVLAGAIAAGHRRRVYDAVVLKVLGATRGTVLRAFLLEYGLLGLITAAVASLLGSLVAWAVLTRVMELEFVLLPSAVATTALLCTGITLGLGFIGTWRALGQPAAPLLRNE
ncbi:ABC transporter permease [Rhodospirillum centenum]|uniref:ABC transporter, permease protein, putative n=1 Tax=Rhodospirillum centenum (strain ATCC 51521 / SW) TaxID=414684 RepID=B6IVX8_RHOCS|nr:FtsX-like permease family protein [Rhodospirillum centenum]ACJ00452.1 ABC transporter, permease protein, putative [Rhodospirillum centenum SW]